MARVTYSPDVDILVIQLSDKPMDHAEDTGQFIVHLSKEGEPVQLEIQGAKSFVMESLSAIIEKVEAGRETSSKGQKA